MGTAILRSSPNCFRDRFRHHETLALSLRSSSTPPNPIPNVSPHIYRRRKRSTNSSYDRRFVGGSQNRSSPSSSFQSPRPAINHQAKKRNLVMGQVRILKRGETLKSKKNDDLDLLLGSTDRLGPEPATVKRQIRVKELKKTAFCADGEIYAGSSIFESPPPSSLPLPGFIGRRPVTGAANDLRRLLRLE